MKLKNLLLTTLFYVSVVSVWAQTPMPIADARQVPLGQSVTIQGIVTNGAAYDNRNRSRAIQDATAGIWIFEIGNQALQSLQEGDEVRITGVMGEFRTLKQLVAPLQIEVISRGNPLPEPITLTVQELKTPSIAGQYEGMLVKVEDVLLDTPDRVFASGSAGRSYDIDDPAQPEAGNCQTPGPNSPVCNPVYRVNPGNPLVGIEIARGLVSLSGPLGVFDNVFQITPRGLKDYVVGLAVLNLRAENIFSTRFTLKWQTNLPARSIVRWGHLVLDNSITNDVVYDTIYVGTIETNTFELEHSMEITGLQPASLYFFSITSELPDGKSIQNFDVFGTASESSGSIRVVFNRPVDTFLSRNNVVAEVSEGIDEIIAEYIDRAMYSVDVAVYNANQAGAARIIQALNRAHERGVRVRYIYNSTSANNALQLLDANIPRLSDNTRTGGGIMHNKFAVIDPDSRNNSYVITGSGNWTNNNLFQDPNHFLFIQDQALARIFLAEFEEMWGGSGDQPVIGRARFGERKIKNTPTTIPIGGREVNIYFSPSDNTKSAILRAIYSTRNDLRFSLMLITDADLAVAIDSMRRTGWDVKGVVDDRFNEGGQPFTGSQVNWMISRGVNVQRYTRPEQLHHKYMIVNAARPTARPLVVVGSYNWSASANTINDENTLIIQDADIANMFLQEFGQRYFEASGLRDVHLTPLEPAFNTSISVYPNPSNGMFTITNLKPRSQVRLYDLSGRIIWQTEANGTTLKVDQRLNNGVYLLQAEHNGQTTIEKIIINR